MAGIGGRTSTSGQGRKKGVPNKATADARRAIGDFVDGNAGRLQGWLDQIAEGIPKLNAKGEQMIGDDGELLYRAPPSPEKAFSLFQTVIEYHVPKLQRTELTGKDGEAVEINTVTRLIKDPAKAK